MLCPLSIFSSASLSNNTSDELIFNNLPSDVVKTIFCCLFKMTSAGSHLSTRAILMQVCKDWSSLASNCLGAESEYEAFSILLLRFLIADISHFGYRARGRKRHMFASKTGTKDRADYLSNIIINGLKQLSFAKGTSDKYYLSFGELIFDNLLDLVQDLRVLHRLTREIVFECFIRKYIVRISKNLLEVIIYSPEKTIRAANILTNLASTLKFGEYLKTECLCAILGSFYELSLARNQFEIWVDFAGTILRLDNVSFILEIKSAPNGTLPSNIPLDEKVMKSLAKISLCDGH